MRIDKAKPDPQKKEVQMVETIKELFTLITYFS